MTTALTTLSSLLSKINANVFSASQKVEYLSFRKPPDGFLKKVENTCSSHNDESVYSSISSRGNIDGSSTIKKPALSRSSEHAEKKSAGKVATKKQQTEVKGTRGGENIARKASQNISVPNEVKVKRM